MPGDGLPPAERVRELVNGFWAAQVINAAILLGVVDGLAQGPLDAAALAAAASAHAPSLLRLMRALKTLDLVSQGADGRWSLTEAGRYLRAETEGSVRGRALFTGDMLWKQFGDLAHVVRTGGTAPSVPSGAEGFAALASDPGRLHAFQTAMAESSVIAAREAMAAYAFGRYGSVLDLGGGYGGVLRQLLTANPAQTGAVCDLGYLADGSAEYLRANGVADRARFIAGDFFEAVPGGFDCILMKFIVHDWADDPARRILANARASAAATARLVLLEQVVPDRLGSGLADQAVIRADLTMMTVGGKERTVAEYRELLAEAGWRLTQVTPAGPSFSVIEAEPV